MAPYYGPGATLAYAIPFEGPILVALSQRSRLLEALEKKRGSF